MSHCQLGQSITASPHAAPETAVVIRAVSLAENHGHIHGLKNRERRRFSLDLFLSEAYADDNFRCRLIPEVVIMVLRGAQIQRSGPAGCTYLTRRALSSYTAMFLQERSDAVCPQPGSRISYRCPIRFHGEINVGTLTKDSRHMARECDLCHGDTGGS